MDTLKNPSINKILDMMHWPNENGHRPHGFLTKANDPDPNQEGCIVLNASWNGVTIQVDAQRTFGGRKNLIVIAEYLADHDDFGYNYDREATLKSAHAPFYQTSEDEFLVYAALVSMYKNMEIKEAVFKPMEKPTQKFKNG